MKGWIYIFSNPAFKNNIIKIGKTSRTPKERRTELDTTGVPDSFSLEYKAYVKNFSSVERRVHRKLNSFRLRQSREFFNCEISAAVTAIRQCSEVIEESFPSKELAEEIKKRDHDLLRYEQEKKQAIKEKLNKEFLEKREVDRNIEALFKPRKYHDLSPAGKIWRLYWDSGKKWSESLNCFFQFLLLCFYGVLFPICGMGGAFILLGDFEFFLLPVGVIGVILGIKFCQLMYVANDRF